MSVKKGNEHRYRFHFQLLHPRYWLTWAGMFLFFFVIFLPMPFIDWVGGRLGSLAAKKNVKRFKIVTTNLTLCFPEKEKAEIENMVIAHFQAQFRSLLHYAFLWWAPISVVRKKTYKTGFEQIAKYQRQGKKIIILLTHNVGLDFAGAAISMGNAVSTPYKVVRNPVVDWKIANSRLRFGRKHNGLLFTRDDGLRPLIRETRAGKVLIYLADEDLGEKNAVFAPFFGIPKATIPVLGRLAKACDAVVLPCVSCYDINTRRYTVNLLSKIDDLPSGNDEQDSIKMNTVIEQAIEQCPVQYLWTLRYFQTRPAGEDSVYE